MYFVVRLPIDVATSVVNIQRENDGEGTVCARTVDRFVDRSPSLLRQPRPSLKSGSADPASNWAKARLNQMIQLKGQLILPGLSCCDGLVDTSSRIHLDGLAFWDEHHENTVSGPTSSMETRRSVDDKGDIATEAEGGHFPESQPSRTKKFNTSAGGCFGVCIVQDEVSKALRGVRLKPFFYGTRTVVGMTTFASHLKVEAERVRELKGVWKGPGEGYLERFGPAADAELVLKVNQQYCSIQEIIDHVIEQSDLAYRETRFAKHYHIFHDALPQWWEPMSQAYLTEKGFEFRQLRNFNLKNRSTRYDMKLVGNSPEICRGLDSHGFADLKHSVRIHSALTSVYDLGDYRRFDLSTVGGIISAMERCWQLVPTSERIIEDILALPIVVNKIIESEGCLVKVSTVECLPCCTADVNHWSTS